MKGSAPSAIGVGLATCGRFGRVVLAAVTHLQSVDVAAVTDDCGVVWCHAHRGRRQSRLRTDSCSRRARAMSRLRSTPPPDPRPQSRSTTASLGRARLAAQKAAESGRMQEVRQVHLR